MSTAALPLLLLESVLGAKSEFDPQEWKLSRYHCRLLNLRQQMIRNNMTAARQLIDGKAFKKVRPKDGRLLRWYREVSIGKSPSFSFASWDLTGTIVTQDIVKPTVSIVHEASAAVYNRCMELFGPDAPVPVPH